MTNVMFTARFPLLDEPASRVAAGRLLELIEARKYRDLKRELDVTARALDRGAVEVRELEAREALQAATERIATVLPSIRDSEGEASELEAPRLVLESLAGFSRARYR